MLRKFLKPSYILLFLILSLGLFLRVFNIHINLGFYYDQGRDALTIWNLWHNADLFLIGPTTGIAGIFRGPYYYYLIAPFYLIGGGNPIFPSVFLSLTTVMASFMAYVLGEKFHSKEAGIIAAFISAFSFNIVMASRWLSNPTPMLILSMLLVLFMWQVTEGQKKAWIGISAVFGLSLFSFGSSGEFFYLIALILFTLWQRKNLPDKKVFTLSVFAFLLTVLPLLVFDLKHDFLITQNIKKFFIEDRSFRPTTLNFVGERLSLYNDIFGKLLFHSRGRNENILLATLAVCLILSFKKLLKLKGVKILLILLGSVTFGLIFFQGNEGNFYDYYLTGYFLIFILLVAITMGEIWKYKLGKLFVAIFFFYFVLNNYQFLKIKVGDQVDGPGGIALKTELAAVNWVYQNASDTKFNVDVYVPPVISYSYDYLFLWKGNGYKVDTLTPLLYTIYEGEPSESERLRAWLERQDGIGTVLEEVRFGGVSVQKRTRINK